VSWLRARVVVSGRVQGVWFRESMRRRADELGVGGWVRNLPDGRVEALFEGPEDRVIRAIEFVKVGPPLARVQDVVVVEEGRDEAPNTLGSTRFRIG
jgi:acylphosphatase